MLYELPLLRSPKMGEAYGATSSFDPAIVNKDYGSDITIINKTFHFFNAHKVT